MGTLAHKHGIPVTWMLSPKSARCEVEMLTRFHEEYGDEAGMMFRFPAGEGHHHSDERTIAENMSVENYRNHIRKQKQEIERYLPWADVKVCGQGIRTDNMISALEQEGFVGIFGHCYCQIGTDSITDFGMPWGSFPMRSGSAHLPSSRNGENLISFEWTMRDLTKSMHTTRPELWSTDPNDVERGGVCSDENVEYWKNMFMEYEKALSLNPEGIWFQFHQESHEQTWGEVCHPFTQERVEFCTKMMDKFFEWVTKRENVEFLTATEAAHLYREKMNKGTIPMYVPFKWVEVPKEMEFWEQVEGQKGYAGNIHKNAHLPDEDLYTYLTEGNNADRIKAMESPKWKESFFYFDHECQLAFDIGKSDPFVLLNYLNYEPDPDLIEDFSSEQGGGAVGFFIETEKPKVNFVQLKGKDRLKIIATNPQEKITPYGLFLWKEDYPSLENTSQKRNLKLPDFVDYKFVPGKGFFLRFNLLPGKTEFTI